MGVIDRQSNMRLKEFTSQVDIGTFAKVVAVLLEGEPQHKNAPASRDCLHTILEQEILVRIIRP